MMRHLLAMVVLLIAPAYAKDIDVMPASRKADSVVVIPIEGPIDSITTQSVRRRLETASDLGADAVVLELNTPGGELGATLEITHLIRTSAPANTIAWIRPFAFSAGTIIALSAREIVVAPDAMFGDAAPVTGLGPIPVAERAKIESPLLAEVTDAARRRHYDEKLVQAFVSVGIELWLLEDTRTGDVVFMDRTEYQDVFGEEPRASLPAITPPRGDQPVQVSPWLSLLSQAAGQATDAPDEDIAGLTMLPEVRSHLTPDDAPHLTLLGQVVANDRLLTLKPWQASLYGLSAGVVADDQALAAFTGATTVTRLDRTWSESLVRALMAWPVRLAFVALFVICLFIEMALPGTGWFGLGAAIALGVLLGVPLLAGMASWWDLAAVVIGLLLIGVELLLIPGTIVAGMTGAALLLMGLIGSAVSGDMADAQGQAEFLTGGLIVIGGGIIGWAGAWFVLKRIGATEVGGRLVLKEAVGADESGQPPLASRVDLTGTAMTDLRPSGRVLVDGHAIDAVCSGRWITAGTAVRIVADGLVVKVEPIDS